MSEWLEIIVPTTVAATEDVAAALIGEVEDAATGAEIRKDEIVFWVATERAEAALEAARSCARRLADAGVPVSPSEIECRPAVPEAEWRDAWKRYFHVTRLSPRIVVVPSWESYEPAGDDIVIDLDPGQAFGTGAHASTQLVLEALDAHEGSGAAVRRFCDVGCGSGILSIAAAKLWPEASGVAVDVEAAAVQATRDNCVQNRVAGRVEVSGTAAGDLGESFELVMANIQSHVLTALAADIAARVAPGGVLMLSGLLSAQAPGVAEVYARHGLARAELTTSDRDREWTGVVMVRPAKGASAAAGTPGQRP